MMLGILFSLLFLAVPVALIAVAVALFARRDRTPEVDPGIGTVRRLFIYGVALLALAFAATGITTIVGGALDVAFGDRVLAQSDTTVATALAFTIVGVPAWLLMAALAQRSVARYPVERRSEARRLYAAFARSVALVIVMVAAAEILQWLVRVEEFNGDAWGALLAWGGVLLLHDRIRNAEPAETPDTRLHDRLALYFGTVVGLAAMLATASGIASAALNRAYDAAPSTSLIGTSWRTELLNNIPWLVVGAAVWLTHWVRGLSKRDALTPLWATYVFIPGILLGLILVLGPATITLYTTLEWLIGTPLAGETAADHFDELPELLATVLVGALSLGYHRALLHETLRAPALRGSTPSPVLGEGGGEGLPAARSTPLSIPSRPTSAEDPAVQAAPAPSPLEGEGWGEGYPASGTSAERVYRYLVAAAGLLMLAGAVAATLALAIDLATPDAPRLFRTDGWWRDQIAFVLSITVTGLPLWLYQWRGVQRAANANPEERASLSRRIYVFGIFGAAVLVVLTNLTYILYTLIEDALAGTFAQATLQDVRWSIAAVLTAAAIAAYHWAVLREDQTLTPEPAEAPPAPTLKRDVILLAGTHADEIAAALSDIANVTIWRLTEPDDTRLDARQLDALRQAITTVDRLLVVIRTEGIDLASYRIDS